jgi:siroheme synthase-like protein
MPYHEQGQHSTGPGVPAQGNRLFPVFLRPDRLSILLVGGGYVAREKLGALLRQEPDARVHVVATTIAAGTRALCQGHAHVLLTEEPFSPEHLTGKHLVIVAVNDKAVSARIHALARAQQLLVNVADTPHLCDLYLGAIVSKGDLKIAISTNGRSPTIAKRLRELLEQELPEELDDLLQHMNALRLRLRGDFAAKVHALDKLTRRLVQGSAPLLFFLLQA